MNKHELEKLQERVAKIEDLFLEFAQEMRRGASQSWLEVQRLSKEIEVLAAKRARRAVSNDEQL